jgi:hypothetical protein
MPLAMIVSYSGTFNVGEKTAGIIIRSEHGCSKTKGLTQIYLRWSIILMKPGICYFGDEKPVVSNE